MIVTLEEGSNQCNPPTPIWPGSYTGNLRLSGGGDLSHSVVEVWHISRGNC